MRSRVARLAPIVIVASALAAGIIVGAHAVNPVLAAQQKPDRLKAVLNQMNAASAKFQSAQADLRQEIFTKVVHDTETRTGQIYFIRKAGSTQMGMKLLPADAAPGAAAAQIVEFKDSKLRVFNPPNHVDEFVASGKNQAMAESLLTLGLGGSGSDLEKSWTIDDQGTEPIDDGGKSVPAEKLDLVSKDASIRSNYSHITIWMDPERDVTLKQTLFEASGNTATGDTRTVYFTNIRLNQPVDVGPFAIKCKGNCTVVSH